MKSAAGTARFHDRFVEAAVERDALLLAMRSAAIVRRCCDEGGACAASWLSAARDEVTSRARPRANLFISASVRENAPLFYSLGLPQLPPGIGRRPQWPV